jgi:hypothetical protein
MGRWAQAHRRGTVGPGDTRRIGPPPAPVIDKAGGATPGDGLDVASQVTLPTNVGGGFTLYVQVGGVGPFGQVDTAGNADGNPYFSGGEWAAGDHVRVTETGDGVSYVGESNPSNIEVY